MLRRIAVILFVLGLASFAFGEKKTKEPQEKAVSGVVTDASGRPVPGAVVQLKNTRTLQVRSFIAREKGDYRFQGLSTDVDYELRAESNGKSSDTKTLSSFDSHEEATINLQLKK
ncbi:MAG TPA: carboxypeptidase-like regulatory domain-containing protein [Bryobacteraceae bacterium]|nr:carboxypeptidase-like regulatory domain-containing protein [Bryobacteraceae bacterium]